MDGNSGLGKLLPKSIAAKRRRRKQAASGNGSGDDAAPRGRSVGSRSTASRETTESDGTSSLNVPDEEEEEETSLISYESDHDLPATRPTTIISTHPSQIGYLTTNSPLVQADHLHDIQTPEATNAGSTDEAFPDLHHESASARPLSASSTTSLVPPQPKSSQRSPSPVGRFKDVFKPKKNSSSTTSSSPERGTSGEATQDLSSSKDSRATPDTETKVQPLAATPDTSKVTPAERFRRLSRGQKIDTSTPPRTPPTSDQGAPVIVNTPPTPTESSHDRHSGSARTASPDATAGAAKPDSSGSPPGNMIPQRRGRSASGSAGPSKLSNITLAPLTPTPENGPGTPSSSFFSSMISAAQSATNTLSNTITNTNIPAWNSSNKRPSSTPKSQLSANDDNIEVESASAVSQENTMDSKELAVNTLGRGDLSLSQLGIPEPGSATPTPTASKFQDQSESRGRSESAPAENNYSYATAPDSVSGESQSGARPISLHEPNGQGDGTTPSSSIYEGKSGVQRSGSIRSAIGKHRKRGSSITTGGTAGTAGTIGAAILAANASVAHPTAQGSTPKLTTGFAVANKKRNRDFHTLFKSVPDDDYLIDDYGCALQRDILLHGRLYISEGHLCFSSNILGWTTTLVLSFDEIIAVEKRSTALLFKNGLMISTLHVKHIFASFMSRDSVYDLVVKIWKLGHPSLQSSLNGVRIDETGGDKTEKVDPDGSVGSRSIATASEDDDSEEEDDVYDEDEENDGDLESTNVTDSGLAENDGEKSVSRRPSGVGALNGASADKSKEGTAATAGGDFPGPATHAPTDCGDSATHYDKFLADEVIPAPLGKVYNLMFGPASPAFMSKWLSNDQKCTEVQMEDSKGLTLDNKSHSYTYIKPLYAAIGPRSTKCMVTEQLENFDLEKAVNINCTTQNPDVPNGNIFSVKTKYCLSWGENNGTRVQVNCTVEWTGKSWIKGTIEKAANEGQTQYCKDLFSSIRAATSARSRGNTLNGKPGKKKRKGKSTHASSPTSDNDRPSKTPKKQDWGLFEPLHGILGPIVDIIGPLMTGNVVYGLLVGLLVASWFGFGFTNRRFSGGYGHDLGYYAHPDRLAAYDEIWRREESELWEWLEERVGIERLQHGTAPVRKRAVEPRTVEEKLREDRMDDREIREAIRVTEEKLKVLKSVIHKKDGSPTAGSGQANEPGHSEASS